MRSVLPGITRASVIALARDRGIAVHVGTIGIADVRAADEVFFTGTAVEVTPLACIDDRAFSKERPVTKELREAYARAARGDDPKHTTWTTFVNERVVATGR